MFWNDKSSDGLYFCGLLGSDNFAALSQINSKTSPILPNNSIN